MSASVIVGYDTTANSRRAVEEAAREAEASGATLTVVHAYGWVTPVTPTGIAAPDSEQASRQAAEGATGEIAQAMRDRFPGLRVEVRIDAGKAVDVLAAVGHGADLIVVGNRGHGGFAGLLLGSVSARIPSHACCPVLVVRGSSRPRLDRVVVGVDLDGPCDRILEFAFLEASRREAALSIVNVWDEPWLQSFADGLITNDDFEAVRADRESRLEALARPWQAKFPDVRSEWQLAADAVDNALVEASIRADLLVIGARRCGDGKHGMRPGPVVNTALRHSECPVAVVPLDRGLQD